MNKDTILKLLRDCVITESQAIKMLSENMIYEKEWRNSEYTTRPQFERIDSEEVEYVNYDEAFDGNNDGYDYFDDYLESLNECVKLLSQEVKNVIKLWTGIYKTDFKALTPDMLTELNQKCNEIQKLSEDRSKLLVELVDCGCEPEELSAQAHVYSTIEKAIVYCITQSWKASTGVEVDANPEEVLRNLMGLNMLEEIDTNMLRVVTVTPWDMPPCPALVIPERPAVILEVMQIGDDWVSAGIDDVFKPMIMVPCLMVDEPLTMGDRIIVKGSKCHPQTMLIEEPEYDGMAEPDCPLSSEDELLGLKYDFDPAKEQKKLFEKHKNQWLRTHWKVLTEKQLCQIADGELIEDEDVWYYDNLIKNKKMYWDFDDSKLKALYETIKHEKVMKDYAKEIMYDMNYIKTMSSSSRNKIS